MGGSDTEKIQKLIDDVTAAKQTASQIVSIDPVTKRLVTKSPSEAANDPNLLKITPEDMIVSAEGEWQ